MRKHTAKARPTTERVPRNVRPVVLSKNIGEIAVTALDIHSMMAVNTAVILFTIVKNN